MSRVRVARQDAQVTPARVRISRLAVDAATGARVKVSRQSLFAGQMARVLISRQSLASGLFASRDSYGIEPGTPVTMTVSADGTAPDSYVWRQISGPGVTLTVASNGLSATWTAPTLLATTMFTFGVKALYGAQATAESVITHEVLYAAEQLIVGGTFVPAYLDWVSTAVALPPPGVNARVRIGRQLLSVNPAAPPPVFDPAYGWREADWVRPTGANYVRYEDLYVSGDTLQQVINKVTAHKVLTFPPGVFTFRDFSYAGTVGINVGPNCGGLMGSGRSTVFQMEPGTSTKASLVPAQGTGGTNPLWMMRIRDNNGAHFRGFRFIGTDQGHLYNGIGIQYSADSISSHLYLQAASWGDAASPPGETFSWGNNHADRCKLWDTEIDGRTPDGTTVSASPLGWNNSADADVRRVYAHHSRAGMPTWWQTDGIYTEDLVHYLTGNGHGLNHENSNGTILHVRPVMIVGGKYAVPPLSTGGGLHIMMANATADMTDFTVVDPIQDRSFHKSGGLCIAQYAGWNTGGLNKVTTYPTVIRSGASAPVYNGRTVPNPGTFTSADSFVYN